MRYFNNRSHALMKNEVCTEKLKSHYETLRTQSLKQFFAQSPDRFATFSAEIAGLFIDYSKNWIVPETLALLCTLAHEKKLPNAISALFSGKIVNFSEQRSALHAALRLPKNTHFMHNGVDIAADAESVLQKMGMIAEQLAEKKLLGATGKPIDTILHVGVGGSGLGPELYYQSMVHDQKNAACHFLTVFDFSNVQAKLALCNPETTIAIFVSKSFTTEETMTMCDTIRAWFGAENTAQKQCYAVTAEIERAITKGFLQANIFPFWDFIGGRYSIWSAVNFANVLVFGVEHFRRFLSGAHAMDVHFQSTPFEKNMPVVMALLAFWYNHFFHVYSKAVVPYGATLSILPLYLQQLHMESLGKSVTTSGEKITSPTGQVIWGDVGPSSQHSFHQLLMQGSHLVPVDFILPFYHDDLNEYDIKRAAYCLSQSQTLMQGHVGDVYQSIEGDRPSTTILIRHFSPETLGALLALYEHQVFVESVLLDINPFDQWGVERAKTVAKALSACLTDGTSGVLDGSTAGLLEKILQG